RYRARTDRHRRVSVRRALRADQRHAARGSSRAHARVHALCACAHRRDAGAGRHALGRHQGRLRQVRGMLVALVLRGLTMFIDAIEPDVSALAYTPAEYRIKWATLPWEAEEAYKLRRAVFCVEQGVFVG